MKKTILAIAALTATATLYASAASAQVSVQIGGDRGYDRGYYTNYGYGPQYGNYPDSRAEVVVRPDRPRYKRNRTVIIER